MGKLWRLGAVVLMLLAAVPSRAAAAVPLSWPDAHTYAEPDIAGVRRALAAVTEALRSPVVSAAGATIDGYGGVTAIGGAHTCTVILFSDVWCWGANADGQLGDGTTEDSAEPLLASPSGDLVDRSVLGVVAGRAHTCALVASGGTSGAYCWGANDQGQLGDGSLISRSRSVEAAGDIAGIAAGEDHTCVIAFEMTVSCWGRNDAGQLGSGSVGAGDPNPQEVPGLTDIVDIAAAGDTTCAVNDTGGAWCWGSDAYAQLGDGGGATVVPVAAPVPVTAVPGGFAQISVGRRHVCGLAGERSAEGTVYCWGADDAGQAGNGPATGDVDVPAEVVGGTAYAAVSAGGDSTCALRSTGQEHCWGDNTAGQLSTGDTTARDAPEQVDQHNVRMSPTASRVSGGNPSMVVDVAIGLTHSCVTDPMMTVYCTVPETGLLTEIPLAPGPAAGLRATAGDATIEMTWSPPDRTGAAPIDGYIAVALTGGDSSGSDPTGGDSTGMTGGDSEGEAGGDPPGAAGGDLPGTAGGDSHGMAGTDPLGMAGACDSAGDGRTCVIAELTNGQRYPVLVVALSAGGLSYSGLVSAVPVAAADPAGPGPGPDPDPGPDPGVPGGGDLPVTGPGSALGLALVLILIGGVLRSRHASGGPARG